jgi:hypothetical protein
MDINDIYEEARARGLSRSARRFSTDFLRMAPNYAADTRLARCSAGALLNLYKRLGELGQADLQALAFARLLDAETRGSGAGTECP